MISERYRIVTILLCLQMAFVLLDLIGSYDVQFHNFFDSTSHLYEILVKQGKYIRYCPISI